jgi:hypothetical protein
MKIFIYICYVLFNYLMKSCDFGFFVIDLWEREIHLIIIFILLLLLIFIIIYLYIYKDVGYIVFKDCLNDVLSSIPLTDVCIKKTKSNKGFSYYVYLICILYVYLFFCLFFVSVIIFFFFFYRFVYLFFITISLRCCFPS